MIYWRGSAIRAVVVTLFLIGVSTAAACGESKSSEAPYSLTDTALDAEHLLSWETVVNQCPLVPAQPLLEGFARKGERVEIAPGEWMEVSEDSGSLWGSSRAVRDGDPNTGDFRSFNVAISFVESDATIQQLLSALKVAGMEVEEGVVTTGLVESPLPGLPKAASQINAIAISNRLAVYISAVTGGDESPYCQRDGLDELIQHAARQLQTVRISE